MKILVAPTALKGSLGASEAAETIAAALRPLHEVDVCPVADGGDGTAECLAIATGGILHRTRVSGPLPGMTVDAEWAVLGDGTTAVVEMASAAGLRLLTPAQFDVARATTRGVGELVRAVLDKGFRKILIGLGGSATNDAGAGMIRALGGRFLTRSGKELPEGGASLIDLDVIDLRGFDARIAGSTITVLSDVTNPLCGPRGAAATYGPQKGATPEMVKVLDSALHRFADVVKKTTGRDVAEIPGAGAAGGMGAGLVALCGATIVPGIDTILELARFDERARKADVILTAEGSLDSQTGQGKAISGIARIAKAHGRPLHVFAGRVAGDSDSLLRTLGLSSVRTIPPPGCPLDDAMRNARAYLTAAVKKFAAEL